jgi:UDP-N-acetylglucosamine 4,6-dehydratase
MDLNGKSVLVTGGTGSFGKVFIKRILSEYDVSRLVVFSRDEWKQQQMRGLFPEDEYPQLRYFIGNVRDKARLYRAFDGVDVVIHAAALKQVPTAEYNPFEAIKTNVIGGQNVIDAAIDCDVERVVALSTDKAANPINLYGASKLCADKLFTAGNHYSGKHHPTIFSVVRYGNVVGSRGSVIPFFLKQRKKGVLPITDKRMTRFWITLSQAVDLVMTALEDMRGGEIFVPKIPSMKIVNLARAIAPDAELEEVGIRPGEKIHEMMIPRDEGRNTLEFEEHYIVQPAFHWWNREQFANLDNCQKVADDFEYVSNENDRWLTVEELRELIKQHSDLEFEEKD